MICEGLALVVSMKIVAMVHVYTRAVYSELELVQVYYTKRDLESDIILFSSTLYTQHVSIHSKTRYMTHMRQLMTHTS